MGLLAKTAVRRVAGARTTYGPTPPAGAVPSGCIRFLHPTGTPDSETQGTGADLGRYPLYGPSWPPPKYCYIAIPARRTSWWARPPRAVAAANSRVFAVISSIPSSCAPGWKEIRLLPSFSTRCAKPFWKDSLIRIAPFRCWSNACNRLGIPAILRFSRSCSRCGKPGRMMTYPPCWGRTMKVSA